MARHWNIQPEWQGETAYIVAGGPSVKSENLELLKGKRVIAINSSYEAVPFADLLFFADSRWWNNNVDHLANWAGRIATVSTRFTDSRFLRLRRRVPNTEPRKGPIGPGLAIEPNAVVACRTSLQGGMNIAFHLGANRIVLIGADMGRAPDGSTHHHTPHPWNNKPGNRTWDIQMSELALIAAPLRERGVIVVNSSPTSRIPDSWGWQRIPLAQVV
jgi:hypothetical protein